MTYPYENLTPERFQEFVQALLTKEVPALQVLPVAQPDGGRDAFVCSPNKKIVVFQVKFKKGSDAPEDLGKWLSQTLDEDVAKITKRYGQLIEQYFLITNVKGSAHPSCGTIDKLNEELTKKMQGVPSICWWRDDLDRRLDDAWNIKWSYPELMTGVDYIRLVIESAEQKDQPRLDTTIRTFLTDQYEAEKQVKFKQVDLQNDLIELFVDIPIACPEDSDGKKRLTPAKNIYRCLQQLELRKIQTNDTEDEFGGVVFQGNPYWGEDNAQVKAASFLLCKDVQDKIDRIVLEGAPGQGKSTISQYICQIHRARMLTKSLSSDVPDEHRRAPVRLPIKVDLRDFAMWITKRDPFSIGDSDANLSNWRKSIESFLCALIRHHTGGASFSVDDLHVVLSRSRVLLVLDGLDEVGDINQRKEVVDEIQKGTSRLSQVSKSLQVVVTSRPAAFANSPGLSPQYFQYVHLTAIDKPIIKKYAEKWSVARKLTQKERHEIQRILRDKLEQAHLRELTKNPMQLSILLSLIQTRGASLPEKRTALYDSYMELFFNRESEKSEIVRAQRDLLKCIHQYLAWILQTAAEAGNNGSISEGDFKMLVREYLEKEGYDVNLAEQLFSGMVERVVALVQRVQGSYEFEVQPLREYFAARFLYETAPYSPPGNERQGTKLDRFNALARNFFWFNVTRFYAGCYSKGELPSLVSCIQELCADQLYGAIAHPRLVAATLLNDWVFTQHPISTRAVVRLLLDEYGLRLMSSSYFQKGGEPAVALSESCGRSEVLQQCFDVLKTFPPKDCASDLIELIRINTNEDASVSEYWWQQWNTCPPEKQATWFEIGLHLGVVAKIDLTTLMKIAAQTKQIESIIKVLIKARRHDFIFQEERSFKGMIDRLLDAEIGFSYGSKNVATTIDACLVFFDPNYYQAAFAKMSSMNAYLTVADRFINGPRIMATTPPLIAKTTFAIESTVVNFCNHVLDLTKRPCVEWVNNNCLLDSVVEKGRKLFGEHFSFLCIAICAANLPGADGDESTADNLCDHSTSLVQRLRSARVRAGRASWWQAQWDVASDDVSRMTIIMSGIAWAGPTVLSQLASELDKFIIKMPLSQWLKFANTCKKTMRIINMAAERRRTNFAANKTLLSDRLLVLLNLRFENIIEGSVLSSRGASIDVRDIFVLDQFCIRAMMCIMDGSGDNDSLLAIISLAYRNNRESFTHYRYRMRKNGILPEPVARKISESPSDYPLIILQLAERTLRSLVSKEVLPVESIAEKEKWFN